MAKVLELKSIIPSKEIPGLISFRMDWLDLLAVQGTLKSPPTPQFKRINSSAFSLLHSPTLTSIHDHRENHSLVSNNPQVSASYAQLLTQSDFCMKPASIRCSLCFWGRRKLLSLFLTFYLYFGCPGSCGEPGRSLVATYRLLTERSLSLWSRLLSGPHSCGTRA